MKISRIILIVLVIIVIGVIALYAYSVYFAPTTTTISPWLDAQSYPLQASGTYGVSSQACVSDVSQIYCIGGIDVNTVPYNNVYISSPLSPNITSWTSDPNIYPVSVDSQACVVSNSNVYCVGGSYDDSADDTALSYVASINSSGALGTWNATTAYPIPVDTESCVASSSYIYCIGGYNETNGNNLNSVYSSSSWYAPLSPSGIGTWTETTPYPAGIYLPECAASGGYVYCIGGSDSSSNPVNNVYEATLSSSGIGTWGQTSTYPISVSGQSCVISSGYIYCVGGESASDSFSNAVYYATISSSGVGSWNQSANYPDGVATDCVISSGYMYCIGGADSSSNGETPNVYYYALSSISG
jgi:Kelch motif